MPIVEDGGLNNDNILELQRAVNAGGSGGTYDVAVLHDGAFVSALGVTLGAEPIFVQQGGEAGLTFDSARAALHLAPLLTLEEGVVELGGFLTYQAQVTIASDDNIVAAQPIVVALVEDWWLAWAVALHGGDEGGDLNTFDATLDGALYYSGFPQSAALIQDGAVLIPDADGGFAQGGASETVEDADLYFARFTANVRVYND